MGLNYNIYTNEYTDANFLSNFDVSKRTKKVVQERAEDAAGVWIYNREFPEWRWYSGSKE